MNHITQLLKVVRAYREYVDALPKDLVLPAMPGFDRDWADTIEVKAHAALAQPEPEPVSLNDDEIKAASKEHFDDPAEEIGFITGARWAQNGGQL